MCGDESSPFCNASYPPTVADTSDCRWYFRCAGGEYRRTECSPPGFVYDVDISTVSHSCVPVSDSFDCSYRCKTEAPTTQGVTLITADEPTTAADLFTTTAELTG